MESGTTQLCDRRQPNRLRSVPFKNLLKIIELRNFAWKTRAVIRQNIFWAIMYNVTVLPLAASGLVLPWLAASGMALSSFVVTLNSMRLLQKHKPSSSSCRTLA